MSLVTEHWEWDGFWQARRRGRQPALPGALARGEPRVDEHQARCEVELRPGFCVAWTAREGFCQEPTDGVACVKHAEDFTPIEARRTNLTAEDIEYLKTIPRGERGKVSKRLSMKRAREDPAYREMQARRKRERRASHRGTDAPLPTATKDARREAIVAELHESGAVKTHELAVKHGVSDDTIMEDLRHLAAEGKAVRRYGGATLAA